MAMIQEIEAYSVSQVNYYLKELVAADELLSSLAVKGELSGYKRHSSGHVYFTLKDHQASIRAVMFRRFADHLAFKPQDGMSVVVLGRAAVYDRDGSCQLYVEELCLVGTGHEHHALEQLKKQLAAEGLFAEERKQPLPFFATSIGVVSSAEGAAWADTQKVAYARWPLVKLKLYPTLVQGTQAAEQMVQALKVADKGRHDLLIVTRGGGSYEDLAVFNDEAVVRAIAATQTPVITAVGHEIDFTLADLVADLRAATPSHAAQIAVPDAQAWLDLLAGQEDRLVRSVQRRLQQLQQQLDAYSQYFSDPWQLLADREHLCDENAQRLMMVGQKNLADKQQQLTALIQALDLLNPARVLARGYALCSDQQGRLISNAGQVNVGDTVQVTLARVQLACRVEEKEDLDG